MISSTASHIVKDVVQQFETEYGNINLAIGHSLGGRLVEVVVQNNRTLGVTFKSLLGNRDNSIIAFQVAGDVAQTT